MKILITADPELPVPPIFYGGVERLIDGLITQYSRSGHEVFLLANPGSTSKDAEHIYKWPALSSRGWLNIFNNAFQLFQIYNKTKPDIVHGFSRLLYTYPLLLTSNVPFVQTYGRRINPYSTCMASIIGGTRMNFTAAADHMLNHLRDRSRFAVVYNFTMVDYFTPLENPPKEHLMFLGRIEDIKGTKECIEVALATNNKLIIAGNIQPGHEAYFDAYIKPYLSNPLIEYIGPVNDDQKRYYLQRAKALLFPIKWEEPFGMVMAEAMSCGTPVVAFRRGSVSEIIKHSDTGFIVANVNEMIKSVEQIHNIDRIKVRQDCVNRFSLEVIAQQYLYLFEKILYSLS